MSANLWPDSQEVDVRILQACGVHDVDVARQLLVMHTVADALTHYISELWDGCQIAPLPHPDLPLRGMVNCGNSCYISSTVFAMFGRTSAFDLLLEGDIKKTKQKRLQMTLRFVVAQLRTGVLVNKYVMQNLRQALSDCGFPNASHLHEQQDASELFLHIMDCLQAPCLPLRMHLFHGGTEISSDESVVTERLFPIDIPEGSLPISLEELLMNYFHGTTIDSLRREVPAAGERPLRAWRSLLMLPFYTISSESSISEQSGQSRLVLPIVLKRYGYSSTFGSYRIKRKVILPTELDFTLFINTNTTPESARNKFSLHLISVVCHRGQHINSGHYVAYAKDEQGWTRFDDSDAKEQRVQRIDNLSLSTSFLYEELPLDAYIAIYELRQKRDGSEVTMLSQDAKLALQLQVQEATPSSASNCVIQ